MGQLAAVEAAQHVASSLSERRDAEGGGSGGADEVDRAGDPLHLLQGFGGARIDGFLRPELLRGDELGVVDVAADDVAYPACLQDGDADEAQPAAAEHRHSVALVKSRKLVR